jgi:outer membrane protein, multidrug efflux system
MPFYKSLYLPFTLLLLLGLGSCQVLKPAEMPAASPVPASFTGGTDTASISRLPWKEFFGDPYLVNLIDASLQSNPDLLVATQRIEQAQASVWLSRGALLPAVSAVTSAGVRKFGDYTIDGVGNYDTNLSEHVGRDRRIPNPTPDFFVGLQSAWEVDLWGKLRTRRKAAYARFLATEKGRHLVTTSLIAEVASRYYELLALDNELETIRKNIGLQEKAVQMINVLKLGAQASELAVQQFRAQLLNTRHLEVQKQRQIMAIENQLNQLLGRFPQPIERGKPIREQDLPDELTAGIPADMLRRRPDIQQAELGLVAARADVQAARAAFFPSLTLSASTGFNAFNHTLLFRPESMAYNLLSGLAAPLWNQRQLRANLRGTTAGSVEAFHTYQKAVLAGYQEVVTSLRNIENLEKETSLKEEEVQALTQAVAASDKLFLAGFASYLEVITAQKSVLQAELQLTEARKDQFLSVVELYRALGGGWE